MAPPFMGPEFGPQYYQLHTIYTNSRPVEHTPPESRRPITRVHRKTLRSTARSGCSPSSLRRLPRKAQQALTENGWRPHPKVHLWISPDSPKEVLIYIPMHTYVCVCICIRIYIYTYYIYIYLYSFIYLSICMGAQCRFCFYTWNAQCCDSLGSRSFPTSAAV